ncbi:MAG: hypothetical protein KF845_14025 [Cyclobacteriaceae bacterium]|nr:hypothetical protein [Cyclobacteriaceae bacterium]
MAVQLNSKHFRHSLVAALLCVPMFLAGQSLPVTIPLNNKVVAAHIDRPGDLYIQFENGIIQKYDSNGKLLQEVKANPPLTIFEPRDGSRAFSYQRNEQWYNFALFGNNHKQTIPEEFAIEPWLVCSSGDRNIWILDGADLSIKKLNTTKQRIDVEISLSSQLQEDKADILTMREYQNLLFIHNRISGIEIRNTIGKHVRVIPGSEIRYFNFLGEELYYALNDKLIFFDLFDGETRELPLEEGVLFLLLSDERVYRVFDDRLVVDMKNP